MQIFFLFFVIINVVVVFGSFTTISIDMEGLIENPIGYKVYDICSNLIIETLSGSEPFELPTVLPMEKQIKLNASSNEPVSGDIIEKERDFENISKGKVLNAINALKPGLTKDEKALSLSNTKEKIKELVSSVENLFKGDDEKFDYFKDGTFYQFKAFEKNAPTIETIVNGTDEKLQDFLDPFIESFGIHDNKEECRLEIGKIKNGIKSSGTIQDQRSQEIIRKSKNLIEKLYMPNKELLDKRELLKKTIEKLREIIKRKGNHDRKEILKFISEEYLKKESTLSFWHIVFESIDIEESLKYLLKLRDMISSKLIDYSTAPIEKNLFDNPNQLEITKIPIQWNDCKQISLINDIDRFIMTHITEKIYKSSEMDNSWFRFEILKPNENPSIDLPEIVFSNNFENSKRNLIIPFAMTLLLKKRGDNIANLLLKYFINEDSSLIKRNILNRLFPKVKDLDAFKTDIERLIEKKSNSPLIILLYIFNRIDSKSKKLNPNMNNEKELLSKFIKSLTPSTGHDILLINSDILNIKKLWKIEEARDPDSIIDFFRDLGSISNPILLRLIVEYLKSLSKDSLYEKTDKLERIYSSTSNPSNITIIKNVASGLEKENAANKIENNIQILYWIKNSLSNSNMKILWVKSVLKILSSKPSNEIIEFILRNGPSDQEIPLINIQDRNRIIDFLKNYKGDCNKDLKGLGSFANGLKSILSIKSSDQLNQSIKYYYCKGDVASRSKIKDIYTKWFSNKPSLPDFKEAIFPKLENRITDSGHPGYGLSMIIGPKEFKQSIVKGKTDLLILERAATFGYGINLLNDFNEIDQLFLFEISKEIVNEKYFKLLQWIRQVNMEYFDSLISRECAKNSNSNSNSKLCQLWKNNLGEELIKANFTFPLKSNLIDIPTLNDLTIQLNEKSNFDHLIPPKPPAIIIPLNSPPSTRTVKPIISKHKTPSMPGSTKSSHLGVSLKGMKSYPSTSRAFLEAVGQFKKIIKEIRERNKIRKKELMVKEEEPSTRLYRPLTIQIEPSSPIEPSEDDFELHAVPPNGNDQFIEHYARMFDRVVFEGYKPKLNERIVPVKRKKVIKYHNDKEIEEYEYDWRDSIPY